MEKKPFFELQFGKDRTGKKGNLDLQKKSFFGMNFGKEERKKGLLFLLVFALVYTVLSFGYELILPLQSAEYFIGSAVLFLLGAAGIQGTLSLQEPVLISLQNGPAIQISYLCTGLMEFFIVTAAIIASLGISWKKRVLGAIAGAIVVFAFNILRIFLTVLIALGNPEKQLLEFTHDILFRVTLFLVIAGTYIVWFIWATGQFENFQKDISRFLNRK